MNLPTDFETYTKALMGEELYSAYLQGMQQEPPTSIRINPLKCKQTLAEGNAAHGQAHIDEHVVPWCPNTGRYLSTRPAFTFDPLFHAGLYYAQEASSMMIDLAIRQLIHEPVLMLDLCAAPGGKTTAARAALPEGSLLVSNEPMRTRAQILVENTQKFGHPDCIITNNYPRDFQKTKLQFDIILADVPCSGEGMFRKDEGAIAEWSTKNVDNCWHLQRDIIADIWPQLKPGGYLVYSTCTYNAHEDEENVQWIIDNLGANPIVLQTDPTWNIMGPLAGDLPVCRFIPGKTKGEGLFMAALQKAGNEECMQHEGYSNMQREDYYSLSNDKKQKKNKEYNKKGKAPLLSYPSTWLTEPDAYECASRENDLYAIPKAWKEIYSEVSDKLRVLHAGIKMATVKGKDLIPDQSLALSTGLNSSNFPQANLSYAQAIQYLRKEAITLPPETPKGLVLVGYKNVPLGWVKNLGNRANNLYPQEWKIKSSHVPEACDVLALISGINS